MDPGTHLHPIPPPHPSLPPSTVHQYKRPNHRSKEGNRGRSLLSLPGYRPRTKEESGVSDPSGIGGCRTKVCGDPRPQTLPVLRLRYLTLCSGGGVGSPRRRQRVDVLPLWFWSERPVEMQGLYIFLRVPDISTPRRRRPHPRPVRRPPVTLTPPHTSSLLPETKDQGVSVGLR